MKQSLELQLVKRFPKIFCDYGGDMRTTCMTWGCECGDGWYDLIYRTCLDIEKQLKDTPYSVIAIQIKEKFGGLRFYYGTEHTKLSLFRTFISNINHRIYSFMFRYKFGILYWKIIDIRKFFFKTKIEKVSDIINKAEEDSFDICEICGLPGRLNGSGWMKTLCFNCETEDKKNGKGTCLEWNNY